MMHSTTDDQASNLPSTSTTWLATSINSPPATSPEIHSRSSGDSLATRSQTKNERKKIKGTTKQVKFPIPLFARHAQIQACKEGGGVGNDKLPRARAPRRLRGPLSFKNINTPKCALFKKKSSKNFPQRGPARMFPDPRYRALDGLHKSSGN